MDDAFRLVREAAGITPQDALDLRRCQRKTQDASHLFADLIDAADHAPLQAAAGGGIGEAVVQAHQVHCPATDVRHDDGRFIQQLRLGQHSGIALGEQFHIPDGDGIVPALIAEGHRFAVPQQIGTELLLVPAKTGQGQAGSQNDGAGALGIAAVQFPGDGCQGQQIVVLRPGLVFLQRLPAAAYHIVRTAVFQHILLGVRLMLIGHQPRGEGTVDSFHGCVTVVHADDVSLAHRAPPPFSFLVAMSWTLPSSSSRRISWRS